MQCVPKGTFAIDRPSGELPASACWRGLALREPMCDRRPMRPSREREREDRRRFWEKEAAAVRDEMFYFYCGGREYLEVGIRCRVE